MADFLSDLAMSNPVILGISISRNSTSNFSLLLAVNKSCPLSNELMLISVVYCLNPLSIYFSSCTNVLLLSSHIAIRIKLHHLFNKGNIYKENCQYRFICLFCTATAFTFSEKMCKIEV